MIRRLPVTLVGGFFGAGKTSLLHHFISEHQGGHLAVLVENPGALNLDAKALGGLCGAMRRKQDIVLEIPNGDEKAQVEWIEGRLRQFAEEGRFERVLIEVGGATNPAHFAAHFGLRPGQPETFSEWAELHQVICVVDVLGYLRAEKKSVEDGFVDFRREQIEDASLLVLNKCDLVSEAERNACLQKILMLNANAKVIETAYGEVPPEVRARPSTLYELGLEVGRRMRSKADRITARLDLIRPPLAGALYRAYRPFHPERFWNWYNADHRGLLRVKGLVWLATRSLLVGGVSRTHWQNACGPAGIWWAALPREEWPEEPEALFKMQETWREPYGDRRQELMLIGDEKLLSALNRQLDSCLLNDEEFARPFKEWSAFPDPFPAWDLSETSS